MDDINLPSPPSAPVQPGANHIFETKVSIQKAEFEREEEAMRISTIKTRVPSVVTMSVLFNYRKHCVSWKSHTNDNAENSRFSKGS